MIRVPATSRIVVFHPLALFPPQILQRLLVLASESLRILEEQLMDPLNSPDVKVTLGEPAQGFSGSGKAYQCLEVTTGMCQWDSGCGHAWLPWDEEQQGWEHGGWCPAVLPCFSGTQLCTAAWGEIPCTRTNLFCVLWFS